MKSKNPSLEVKSQSESRAALNRCVYFEMRIKEPVNHSHTATGELAEGRNFQRLSRIKTATWNLKAKCPLLHPQKFCTWSSCGGRNRGRMLLISILYDP